MTTELRQPQAAFAPGARVQVCNDTLQAFYGRYGTVLRVHICHSRACPTYVDVRMDEIPTSERPATFYPHEIQVLATLEE